MLRTSADADAVARVCAAVRRWGGALRAEHLSVSPPASGPTSAAAGGAAAAAGGGWARPQAGGRSEGGGAAAAAWAGAALRASLPLLALMPAVGTLAVVGAALDGAMVWELGRSLPGATDAAKGGGGDSEDRQELDGGQDASALVAQGSTRGAAPPALRQLTLQACELAEEAFGVLLPALATHVPHMHLRRCVPSPSERQVRGMCAAAVEGGGGAVVRVRVRVTGPLGAVLATDGGPQEVEADGEEAAMQAMQRLVTFGRSVGVGLEFSGFQ